MYDSASTRPAHDQLQTIVFLVVLPVLNLTFVVAILYELGIGDVRLVGAVALRFWLVFGLTYLALRLLGRYVPQLISDQNFLRQLIVHLIVLFAIGILTKPQLDVPETALRPDSTWIQRSVLTLEIVVYLAVRRILRQQRSALEQQVQLKEAELSVLRSQSNPHFLFNTLNLITSEISADPANAREIVFDLADLLRGCFKTAQQPLTTVDEEIRLASLYLSLQQKRFRDRLTFTVSLDPATRRLEVPSLLLQPIVENTVKWAVAPYAGKTHISVETTTHDTRWTLIVRDSGPEFDTDAIVEGNGFRILRETLDLTYDSDYRLSLESAPNGGVFTLDLPLRTVRHNDASA